jgi:hypothetical protein
MEYNATVAGAAQAQSYHSRRHRAHQALQAKLDTAVGIMEKFGDVDISVAHSITESEHAISVDVYLFFPVADSKLLAYECQRKGFEQVPTENGNADCKFAYRRTFGGDNYDE